MKTVAENWEDLTDWDVLQQLLPKGWEEKAKESGALKRAREISNAAVLLQILMLHLANGYSLMETAVRAREAGLAQVSDVAVMKRLRASEEWLRWMAEQVRAGGTNPIPKWNRRVVLVDATTVSEPGSTGTDWRIHYAMNLSDFQCRYFELTDRKGGETWRRFPLHAGDIVMGDRIYSTPVSVAHVVNSQGEVLVRLNRQSLPLYRGKATQVSPLQLVRGLRIGEVKEWVCWVKGPKEERIPGRLIALKRTRKATRHEQKRLRRKAIRKQERASRQSLEAAAYFFLWTTLGKEYEANLLLKFYRIRWQIELTFKRMKSIMGMGHLPKKDPQACRAWLHGKLLISLLIERIIDMADSISPWGYCLEESPESLERNGILAL